MGNNVNTVVPAVCDHPFCPEKVVTYSRWSFTTSKFTKKFTPVSQEMWSQRAGGLSQQWSHTAGTTLYIFLLMFVHVQMNLMVNH